MITAFDEALLMFLNQFSQRSELFDTMMHRMQFRHLLKGAFMMTLLWGLWFTPAAEQAKRRVQVLCTILAGLAALLLGRVLAISLPHRPRPLHAAAEIGFKVPFGPTEFTLEGWSAFPSDHAILFFALACGIFVISKRLGWLCLIYAVFFISLPRIYLGLHYPTDIIVGAVIGITIAFLVVSNNILKQFIEEKIMSVERKWPGWFYAAFFLLTFLLSTLFDDVRMLTKQVLVFF